MFNGMINFILSPWYSALSSLDLSGNLLQQVVIFIMACSVIALITSLISSLLDI